MRRGASGGIVLRSRFACMATLAPLTVLLPATARSQAVAPGPAADDSLARARRFTSWFFEGAADSIWAHLSPGLREAAASTDAVRAAIDRVSRWGSETALIAEGFDRFRGRTEYRRTMRCAGSRGPMMASLIFDSAGRIVGWYQGKASEAPAPDRQ
jgi:hypothetical protein